jgi:hypothetical protein
MKSLEKLRNKDAAMPANDYWIVKRLPDGKLLMCVDHNYERPTAYSPCVQEFITDEATAEQHYPAEYRLFIETERKARIVEINTALDRLDEQRGALIEELAALVHPPGSRRPMSE